MSARELTPHTLDQIFTDYRAEHPLPFEFVRDLFLCQHPCPEREIFRRIWLIDADDTLWEDNVHYEALIGEFSQCAIEAGVPLSLPELRHLINEVEHEIIPRLGFGADGFEVSLRETWRRLTSKYPIGAAGPQVEQVERVLSTVVPTLRGVPYEISGDTREFLAALRSRSDEAIVLFTQGPLLTQIQKIVNSALAPLFHGVAVGANKKPESYQELLRRLTFSGTEVVVVGNSLNSEVIPAITLGFTAVHLDNPNSWHAVNSHPVDPGAYHTVRRLIDVLPLLP